MAEYISREAAYYAIVNNYDTDAQLRGLDEIPAADVRPVVRGKWEHMGGDEWCCSICGHVISTEGSWEHPLRDLDIFFCEQCGADMREVEHD